MGPDGAVGESPREKEGIARRSVLQSLGVGALATGAGSALTACSSGTKVSASAESTSTITLGYVTPYTGSLAGFAAGDKFVISTIRNTPAYKNGFTVGGGKFAVKIIDVDSQSDPIRAAQVARRLVLKSNVDMLLTSSAPETVNPVAVVAETEGVPCLATNDPWESWYAGLGGNPASPTTAFQYCTLFSFGLKEFQGCFVPMWKRLPASSRNVGCQYPKDADGNAFRAGFIPLIEASRYTPVDGGAYTDGTIDFTAMITKFKNTDSQYLSNCPLPPDFSAFWKQANQQGWRPKLATVAKVLLFPAAQLHQRPGPGGGRHPPGRRAVEGEHRQVPLRDEGRRQLAEQGGEARGRPRADQRMMPRDPSRRAAGAA